MLITGVSSSPGYKMVVSLANRYEVVDTYNRHPISILGVTTVKADLTRGSTRLINGYKPDVAIYMATMRW